MSTDPTTKPADQNGRKMGAPLLDSGGVADIVSTLTAMAVEGRSASSGGLRVIGEPGSGKNATLIGAAKKALAAAGLDVAQNPAPNETVSGKGVLLSVECGVVDDHFVIGPIPTATPSAEEIAERVESRGARILGRVRELAAGNPAVVLLLDDIETAPRAFQQAVVDFLDERTAERSKVAVLAVSTASAAASLSGAREPSTLLPSLAARLTAFFLDPSVDPGVSARLAERRRSTADGPPSEARRSPGASA
jgi:hypothetical protein